MTFGLPSALLLAGFAAPIIFFYILKVRLRRVPVSTNMFWQQIFDEKPPRSLWQYLRHLLSLLAQLCILALLVLAVADPYLPWQLLQARRMVVVIDNSSSMRAADVAPTRFQAAINAATDVVEGLRFRDEMAIVVAGPSPEVVLGMSGHIPTLKRALRSIPVSDNPTKLAPAVELGRELLGSHPRGQVIVYTDGCTDETDLKGPSLSSAEQQPSQGDTENSQVEYRLFGTPAANVGITQFQVRRSLVDALGYEVLVAVSNASDQPAVCRLEIELEGSPVDILPLELEPEQTWSRSLQKTSLEGGTLTATLTQIRSPEEQGAPDDESGAEASSIQSALNALSTDDTVWAILPARTIQPVLVVTEGNLFLQKVFEANPQVQIEVTQTIPEYLPDNVLLVLHRDVPQQLPGGNVLVVDPVAGCDQWDLGETLENPIVTEQKKDSPLMAHVRLDNVLMPEARQLKFKKDPQVLASTLGGEPVYALLERDGGKCLILTVNLDKGDLAFRTTFPIMISNALSWFAGASGELQPALATGQVHEIPSDVISEDRETSFVLVSPSGREQSIEQQETAKVDLADSAPDMEPGSEVSADAEAGQQVVQDDNLTLGSFDECGVWRLVSRAAPDQETTVRSFAVNLSSPRESDVRPAKQMAVSQEVRTLTAGWLSRPLWYYLLVGACVASIAEWFAYQRRLIT